MVFLVLDPGLTIGYAVFSNTKFIKSGVVVAKNKSIQDVAYEIKTIYKKFDVKRVIVEDAAFTDEIIDMLERHAHIPRKRIEAYSPNMIRQFLFGDGNMKKQESIYLTKRYIPEAILKKRLNCHELDCITLGIFYLKMLGLEFTRIKFTRYWKVSKGKREMDFEAM